LDNFYHLQKKQKMIVSQNPQVQSLFQEAKKHEAVKHKYLKALQNGDFNDNLGAIEDFSVQYCGYTNWFPKFLTATMAKIDNHEHRMFFIENLSEEGGHLENDDIELLKSIGVKEEWVQGVPHPQLFKRFQTALNIESDLPLDDAVVLWREMFLSVISTGTLAEAIGAIGLGTESIVKFVYKFITKAIQNHTTLTKEQYVFFELHSEIDDEHSALMLKVAEDLINENPANYHDLRKGMLKALNLRTMFWDNMYERAKKMQYENRKECQTIIQ
jgi:pyrroloquinoline quinone (PQQ) biosynthesis protein C